MDDDDNLGDVFTNVASAADIEAALIADKAGLEDGDEDAIDSAQSSARSSSSSSPVPFSSSSSSSNSSSSSSSSSSSPMSPRKGSREEKRLKKQIAKEEEKALRLAKKARVAHLKQVQKDQNAVVEVANNEAIQRRLEWLSKSAGIFSYFTGGKDFTQDAADAADVVAADRANAASSASSSSSNSRKGRKGRMTEKQGDAEELAAMESATRTTRLTVQPECIKFGTMRDYQIEGLNWLISLYDRGINGILADEMVSCFFFFKYFRSPLFF